MPEAEPAAIVEAVVEEEVSIINSISSNVVSTASNRAVLGISIMLLVPALFISSAVIAMTISSWAVLVAFIKIISLISVASSRTSNRAVLGGQVEIGPRFRQRLCHLQSIQAKAQARVVEYGSFPVKIGYLLSLLRFSPKHPTQVWIYSYC